MKNLSYVICFSILTFGLASLGLAQVGGSAPAPVGKTATGGPQAQDKKTGVPVGGPAVANPATPAKPMSAKAKTK